MNNVNIINLSLTLYYVRMLSVCIIVLSPYLSVQYARFVHKDYKNAQKHTDVNITVHNKQTIYFHFYHFFYCGLKL